MYPDPIRRCLGSVADRQSRSVIRQIRSGSGQKRGGGGQKEPPWTKDPIRRRPELVSHKPEPFFGWAEAAESRREC